jgi:Transposase
VVAAVYWNQTVTSPLRGEDSIAELCRREGIAQGVYYKWSKDFMEAGKRRVAGDTSRVAKTDEVRDLRREAREAKGRLRWSCYNSPDGKPHLLADPVAMTTPECKSRKQVIV